MPPCNCGGGTTAKNVYIYTDPQTGQQKTYNTEIEALAAKIRAGGGGSIRVAPK